MNKLTGGVGYYDLIYDILGPNIDIVSAYSLVRQMNRYQIVFALIFHLYLHYNLLF